VAALEDKMRLAILRNFHDDNSGVHGEQQLQSVTLASPIFSGANVPASFPPLGPPTPRL